MEINCHLMSPFVSKVSVEVDTLAETKGDRVGSPVLPPESVHCVGVLVPGVVSIIKLQLKQHQIYRESCLSYLVFFLIKTTEMLMKNLEKMR